MQDSQEEVRDGGVAGLGEGLGHAALRAPSAIAQRMLSAPLGSAPGDQDAGGR